MEYIGRYQKDELTTQERQIIAEQRSLLPRSSRHPGWAHLRDDIILDAASARYLGAARKLIRQHFPMLPGNTVHHIDGNRFNNALWNLMVFATSRDHTRFHRGEAVEPVFMGAWRTLVG